jgi:hypothetical protein
MKIDKDIPFIPAPYKNYPWPEMNVGDSVFFDQHAGGSQSNPAKAAMKYAKNHNQRFAARKHEEGVRVWRIE